jgi:aryl-alcohol dehydrogenase-like predicted oxidoreductase
VGATKVEHIEDAVAAIDVKLNTFDLERLEAKYKPHPIIGHE